MNLRLQVEAKDEVSHSECEFGAGAQTYEQEAQEARHRPAWGQQHVLLYAKAQQERWMTMYHKLPFTKSQCLQKNF